MNISTVLTYLLTTKRPSGSNEETVARALLGGSAQYYYDTKGKFMGAIATVGESRTLFSSHLDTVERNHGTNTLHNYVDTKTGHTFVKAANSILGADDAAGISIMVNMIDNNVPGHYHFYAQEEVGAVGSKYMIANKPELYANIDRAIAFDRRGTSDVICVQLSEDCCSNVFALALSDALCKQGLQYEPTQGVFTDTANMIHLIPECTNLSCGYYSEHTQGECLDLTFLDMLSEATLSIAWESLPTMRSTERKLSKQSWTTIGYNQYHGFDNDNKYDFDIDENIDAVLDLMQMNGVCISDLLLRIKESDLVELL